ncbi:hypothetical protein ABTA78_19785, partial [Acinetobacter baumannii]
SNDSFIAEFDVADKPDWFDELLEWKDIKEYSFYHFKVRMSEDKIKEFKYSFIPWASMPKLEGREIDLSNELVSNFTDLE